MNKREAKKSAMDCAISVAEDLAAGRLSVDTIEAETAEALRELCGTVIGPDDLAWDTQIDIARQVIALGGLSVDELAEWQAVRRQAEGPAPGGPALADTEADVETAVAQ